LLGSSISPYIPPYEFIRYKNRYLLRIAGETRIYDRNELNNILEEEIIRFSKYLRNDRRWDIVRSEGWEGHAERIIAKILVLDEVLRNFPRAHHYYLRRLDDYIKTWCYENYISYKKAKEELKEYGMIMNSSRTIAIIPRDLFFKRFGKYFARRQIPRKGEYYVVENYKWSISSVENIKKLFPYFIIWGIVEHENGLLLIMGDKRMYAIFAPIID